MKQSRGQKRAELEKAAGEVIEALLDWEEKTRAPNLGQIEGEILQLRQQFGQALATRVLENQEESQRLCCK